MGKLNAVSTRELQAELDRTEDAKAVKRLMVALAYKDGVEVGTISNRYDIPQSTIYYWLTRFEEQPLTDALEDEPRPGRPPKLSDEQRKEVASWIEAGPREAGYDRDSWLAEDLRDHICDTFGVRYSVPHVARTFLD